MKMARRRRAKAGPPTRHARFVSFMRLFDRPGHLPRDILQPYTLTSPNSGASLLDSPQELRVILEPVLEPVILRAKPDQHSSGTAMTRDDDLLICGELQVARKIILHLCQGHSVDWAYPSP